MVDCSYAPISQRQRKQAKNLSSLGSNPSRCTRSYSGILLNMKTCIKCGSDKDQSLFAKNGKGGFRNTCKRCVADYAKEWYRKNGHTPQETRKPWQRHGISFELFQEMLSKFNGLCWSCNVRKATHIDHNHQCCPGAYSCGKCVRGILCNQCNTAAGLLGDDPKMAANLATYLAPVSSPPSKRSLKA